MKRAEEIAAAAGYDRLSVIASIGTREALRAHPQYAGMEQQILRMMRDEAGR